MPKKLKNGCIPARRRISSGGKAGSYASPRTGGKQAYATLKKAKPPGTKGGWTKKKCICCHKCSNDRSAPNGFVCINPSHLYWGTKADNTYDQNRGNGWAARNKKKNEGDPKGEKAFAAEMLYESTLRAIISKLIKEQTDSISYYGQDFVKFVNETKKGVDPLVAAKIFFTEIGKGSTRVVFDIDSAGFYVLKVINTENKLLKDMSEEEYFDFLGRRGLKPEQFPKFGKEGQPKDIFGFEQAHKIQSNKWEADLMMQQRYSEVFPRTYEWADDFSWILAEKVEPLESYEEMFKALDIDGSLISNKPRKRKREVVNLIKAGIDAVGLKRDPRNLFINENIETTQYVDLDDNKTQAIEVPREVTKTISVRDQLLDQLLSKDQNKNVLEAMYKLRIPAVEFKPANLGISKISGKLLILDASLWEEHKPVA